MKLLKMSPSSCKVRIPSRANEEPRGKPAIDEPREGRAHAVHVLKNEVPLETWGGVKCSAFEASWPFVSGVTRDR